MNEKQEYQSMIEMHENTCNISYKPIKKRKKKPAPEEIKSQVIEKVNSQVQNELMLTEENAVEHQENTVSIRPKQPKKKTGFSIISAQIMIIGALIATIFLTNALNANSGINTFFKSVFGEEQQLNVDARTYSDFAPTLTLLDNSVITQTDGVITIEGQGSVYSTVNGSVKSITLDEQTSKYTVEVSHSDTFTSVYTGLDFVYSEVGGKVYSNVPLGYSDSQVNLCFYSNDAVITNYELVDDSVVWAV